MLYLFLIATPFAWARLEKQILSAPVNPHTVPASLPDSSALAQPS